MASTMSRGICWALAALQVTPQNVQQQMANGEVKLTKPQPYKLNVQCPMLASSASNLNTPCNCSEKGPIHSNEHNGGIAAAHEDSENVRPKYSRSEVSDHCSSESCWMIINNKVYDVTRFLRMHPGGEDIILEHAGHDATSAFIDKGHSSDAFEMLADYCVGEVIDSDWIVEKNHT